MQDLELESLCNGVGHSQRVLDHPIANDSGSRSCINLPSRTAGFRIIGNAAFLSTQRRPLSLDVHPTILLSKGRIPGIDIEDHVLFK